MNFQQLKTRMLISLAMLSLGVAQAQSSRCAQCEEWNRPQKPFPIFGNTYYVGTHGLSSVLITSRSGDVLIDGGLPESAQQIASNIRTLGFRIQDVKIILNSHVHFDHAGGIAELQRLSGARVLASRWSAAVLKGGGVAHDDPQYGEVQAIAPVRNVQQVRDGENVRVGEIVMTMHLTPGHTPGGTSWTWRSCEGTACRNMVYADSLTPVSAAGFRFSDSRHPGVLQEFDKSFGFLESTPCDVLITTRPEMSRLWERLAAREQGVKPDPMVNDRACKDLAERGHEQLKKRLEQEQAQ